MSAEADIGRAVLERLARANAERRAAAEPLRREIEALVVAGVPAKQIPWKLSRRVSGRYVYRVRREYLNRRRLFTDVRDSLSVTEVRSHE